VRDALGVSEVGSAAAGARVAENVQPVRPRLPSAAVAAQPGTGFTGPAYLAAKIRPLDVSGAHAAPLSM
jgi:hypothetical protein